MKDPLTCGNSSREEMLEQRDRSSPEPMRMDSCRDWKGEDGYDSRGRLEGKWTKGRVWKFCPKKGMQVSASTKVVTATRTVAAEQGRPRIESNRLSASIIHEKWVYCTDACLVSNVAQKA